MGVEEERELWPEGVDVELLDDGSAAVSWLEYAERGADFRIRRIEPSGARSTAVTIARVSGERLIDTRASTEMARRLMALQRQHLAESQVLDRQARRVLHDDIVDVGCSLRAYRRHCLMSIKLYNGMHRFLPVLLQIEGFDIGQVPVHHHPRQHGQSKYNMRNRAWRALMDLLAVRWMQNRQLCYDIIEPESATSRARERRC